MHTRQAATLDRRVTVRRCHRCNMRCAPNPPVGARQGHRHRDGVPFVFDASGRRTSTSGRDGRGSSSPGKMAGRSPSRARRARGRRSRSRCRQGRHRSALRRRRARSSVRLGRQHLIPSHAAPALHASGSLNRTTAPVAARRGDTARPAGATQPGPAAMAVSPPQAAPCRPAQRPPWFTSKSPRHSSDSIAFHSQDCLVYEE